jgi:FkbH-like protein
MQYFDNLQYHEIISTVNKIRKNSNSVDLKIGILRNITVDNYLPLIEYLLLKENFTVKVKQGEYDVIMQEILDSETPINQFRPDILVIFLNIEQIASNLYERYTELSEEEIEIEKEYILKYALKLFEAIHKNFKAKVIFNLFEMPDNLPYNIFETQNGIGLRNLIYEINSSLIKFSKEFGDIYFTDLNLVKEKLGANNYFDKRYWYIAKAPYSLEALKKIAIEHLKIIRSLFGKTKKCLVVDCDNTLWGGIIGEDGIEKIQIGKTYPGNIFFDFQRRILNLFNKGVILAICSKNNENDVLSVLENHPDMLLRKKHFACIYANWNDKAENIKNISSDLNIGLDSIVFVDDSEFECDLVKRQLAEVTVINLPKKIYDYVQTIETCGLFDKLQYTKEDKKRGDLYRTNIERNTYKTNFTDLNSYYKSLEMKIEILPVDDFAVSRVAQLTQRTNQFNLTTKRYSSDEIIQFMNSEHHDVLLLKLSDKFGEMGIVGIQILDYTLEERAIIDSFMMSCRIIGRGVENVFLKAGIDKSLKKNYRIIEGSYIKSDKNDLVSAFYLNNGFKQSSSEGNKYTYQLDNFGNMVPFENYFKEITIK